jgi:hypothetical protein
VAIAPSIDYQWKGSADCARGGLTMAAPFAAPATRFNASVTAERNVALAQLDLDDIKTVKDHFKVTVNDVVMALCAAVLRWFLGDHGELPAKSLVAMVPVSRRLLPGPAARPVATGRRLRCCARGVA